MNFDFDSEFVDTVGYQGPERRREVHISDAQIARIADKAATRAVQQVLDSGYKAVGKNVVEKGVWVIGAIACGLFAYMTSKGWIRL